MHTWALNGLSSSPNTTPLFRANRYDVSEETRTVQQLGQDIQRIQRETEYIKNHGERPPTLTFDYHRQLDVIT